MNKIISQQSINSSSLLDFTFSNLKYSVKSSKGVKEIIKGVDGICPNSQVTAILGSSGAGKTSLLNILTKRIQNSGKQMLEGRVQVNGKEYTADQFSNFANYVMQNDILMETMTVRECLEFAACLKVKGTQQKRDDVVNEVIKLLMLEKCQNTLIGGHFVKGISGGERKRTSIGYELVCDPHAIFLDEPTSGLDSFTAYIVINRLRKFAHEKNRTVVLTIHQPSSDIWQMLDRIMLMVNGRFIYQGPGNTEISNYFNNLGFVCPNLCNPADYYMSIMHQENEQNIRNAPIYFQSYDSMILKKVEYEIENSNKHQVQLNVSYTSIFLQFYYIVKRTVQIQLRSPILFKAKLGQVLSLSVFLGLIYLQLPDGKNDPHNINDVRNKNGFLFFLASGAFMEAMNPCALTIPLERQVFLREENSKLYKIIPYFFGKLFVDLVSDFIIPIIFSSIGIFKIFNSILINSYKINSLLDGWVERKFRSIFILYFGFNYATVQWNCCWIF
ncbi:ABC transporter family protein (macronuclear) [Tetrahymena thermophila SB210]|uniref:ABC transporter family protein n=1 Tax=Tetrahymena thermophila (strain SB210) TaxID=312017 RepID=Q22MN3_TETTS|nr:ABC transporter family protein [Tetrahymena thermophila SB210]EAR86510.2 ABC transporter family protein [Tetrahymena thermophila SB210]|eukprot:XP_976987.2 ABC transporter family protein [Tetrahymena thermophila SB210]